MSELDHARPLPPPRLELGERPLRRLEVAGAHRELDHREERRVLVDSRRRRRATGGRFDRDTASRLGTLALQ